MSKLIDIMSQGVLGQPGELKSATGNNLNSGDNTLLTVPSGKKVALGYGFYLGTATGITGQFWIQRGGSGTKYPTCNGFTINATPAYQASAFQVIADAGDVIGITLSGSQNADVSIAYYEMDESVPVRSVFTTSFSSGDNTIYTCPADTMAMLLWEGKGLEGFRYSGGGIFYSNNCGSSRTIKMHMVPSGGSASDTQNLIYPSTAVADDAITFPAGPAGKLVMTAGDFINLNTNANTAGQAAWVTVAEIPA